MSEVTAQQVEDFSGQGMAPQFGLLEDRRPVDDDLEATAARRDHLDFDAGMRLTERGRQTGGPGLVVSNDAVFDGDLHVGLAVDDVVR